MEEKLMKLIVKAMKIPEQEMDLDVDVFESNMISSLGLLELTAQIENEFHITIFPEELIHENFGTVGSIIRFVKTKVN